MRPAAPGAAIKAARLQAAAPESSRHSPVTVVAARRLRSAREGTERTPGEQNASRANEIHADEIMPVPWWPLPSIGRGPFGSASQCRDGRRSKHRLFFRLMKVWPSHGREDGANGRRRPMSSARRETRQQGLDAPAPRALLDLLPAFFRSSPQLADVPMRTFTRSTNLQTPIVQARPTEQSERFPL
jgi:hypothetical protein